MKQSLIRKKPVESNYELTKSIRSDKFSLDEFENTINSHPKITEEIAKNAISFQYYKLRQLGAKKLESVGFTESDIEALFTNLPSDDLPSDVLEYALLPRWILDYIEKYWELFNPRYEVHFQNDSDWSHDYVVAYETHSGLIHVVETTVEPWATGEIHCAPCWDMLRYAWSVWNPDDNVELRRTPTFTVEEINNMESVYKACEDTWVVRITYG